MNTICLDTNYLIRGLVSGSAESSQLIAWYESGVPMITPAPGWFEFLGGPVTSVHIEAMRGFLKEIVGFDDLQAREAARLYNLIGRKRGLQVDAMIAAAAITQGAELATGNRDDFQLFIPHGLRMIPYDHASI